MTALAWIPSTIDSEPRYITASLPSSSGSSGSYPASHSDFISSFYAVLRRWQTETAFLSDPEKITDHPSFKVLVAHAELVAPLIISELEVHPSCLVWVLEDAFSERPYEDEAVGDFVAMSEGWISWGERNGRTL